MLGCFAFIIYILFIFIGYSFVKRVIVCSHVPRLKIKRRYGLFKEAKSTSRVICDTDKKKAISFSQFLIVSLLFGVCAMTLSPYGPRMDRALYGERFIANRLSDSIGLNLLSNFLRKFTNSQYIYFMFVAFVTMMLFLIAYKLSTDSSSETLLIFLCSEAIVMSFGILKQSIAMGIGSIALVILIDNREKIQKIVAVSLIGVAVLFHESALILLLYAALILFSKNRIVRHGIIFFCIFAVLFFNRIISPMIGLVQTVSPELSRQIIGYLNESGSIILQANITTIFKAEPIYFLTLYIILHYKSLRKLFPNIDRNMVLCVLTTTFHLMSYYMYWAFRFSLYFYLPVCIIGVRIMKTTRNRQDAIFLRSFFELPMILFGMREMFLIVAVGGGF